MNETNTCVGAILNNSTKVFENCRYQKLENFKNKFVYVKGIYYFTINGIITMELLCKNNFGVGQIVLKGTGKVKLKQNCIAKFRDIVLIGAHSLKLNRSFEITYHTPNVSKTTFAYLDNKLIKNITFDMLKQPVLPINHKQNYDYQSHKNYHLYTIYFILILIFTILSVIILKFYKHRILDRKQVKVVKSCSSNSNSDNMLK